MYYLLRSCLFLFFFFMITAARSQLISLAVTEEPLEKVFLLIEQQSDYNFIYTREMMKEARRVSFKVRDEEIHRVIDLCFRDQPLQYSITEKHVMIRVKEATSAQVKDFRGQVRKEDNEPLPGVTITVKGTSLVTTSDFSGNFGFANLPDHATFIVTGAEITTLEWNTNNASSGVIVVQTKLGLLDETVVIAYGKTSRRYATGSVSSIKSSEIAKQPVANVLGVLAARVPGLQVSDISGAPGTYIQMQLRGINSIANGTAPLFVIDGIPFPAAPLNGSLGGGASAAASPLNTLNPADVQSIEVLKDADATSIFGSRGANGVIMITTKRGNEGKTGVSVRVYHGLGKVTRDIDLLNTREYLAMRREAFHNDNTVPSSANAPDLLSWDTTRYTNWQKFLIGETIHKTDANITLTGGSAQTQFLVAAGYYRGSTMYPGDFGDQRKSMSMDLSHRSNDQRFNINLSATFTHYKNVLPTQDLTMDIPLAPNAPKVYLADGSLNWANSSWANPIAKTRITFTTNADNLLANLNIGYRIIKGLQFKVNLGFNRINNRDQTRNPSSARNPAFNPRPAAGFGNKRIQTTIAEPQLEFTRAVKKGILSILVGGTFQDTREYSLYQSATGYSTDELIGSLKAATSIINLSEFDIEYRYSGLFARIKFDWDKKYLLSLTARRDGSSRYGVDNRFANFAAVGAAWIFSNEKLFQQLKWLSFGKIKGSAGITGNDQIGDYRYFDLYAPFHYNYLGIAPLAPQQLYNPEFGWEKVTKLEGGLDVGLFNDRILFSINYYHNTTSNQLVEYPLSGVSGFKSILRNIPARIRNSGLEVELNTAVIQTKAFTWSSSFNITIPRNKLVRFDRLENSSYAAQYVIGQPLSIAQRFEVIGVDTATGVYTFKDFNHDGVISTNNDRGIVIFTGQQFFGGWQNNLKLKRWNLSFLFQFVQRKNGLNWMNSFSRPGLAFNQPKAVLDRWQEAGDIRPIQRYSVSNAAANNAYSQVRLSNMAYSDASFVRLRNLSVSYDLFTTSRLKGLKSGNVFLQGQNLFTITGYDGLDPENMSQLAPPIKLITLGFQLNF